MNRIVTNEEINRRCLDMISTYSSRDDAIGLSIREGIRNGLILRMKDLRKRLGIPHVPEYLQ